MQIHFPHYDKLRILVHTALNLRNAEKPVRWRKDDVILDIETSENVQSTSGKATKASDANKKAGRPAKPKNQATHAWTDGEINVLVEAWTEHKNVRNTKHKSYFNRDIRQKLLSSMENMLKDNGISATVKQIGKKLTDLKNYYRGQKRMIESSKPSGTGADEVYVSPWKFYESLEFLSNAFTLRKTKSNGNDEDDGSPYVDAKPPSPKAPNKLALAQNNELHRVMSTITTSLEAVIWSKRNQKSHGEDVDDTFGKRLVGQLKLIPEWDLKDDLKISLQQMILSRKSQVNSSNKAQQGQFVPIVHMPGPLQQSPFATQHNSMPSFASPQSPLSSLSSQQSYSSSSGSFGYWKMTQFYCFVYFSYV